jgi:hypothetical protein
MFKMALVPFVIFVILTIVFAPFGYIWALNTLFPTLNVPYTFDTWLAMVVAHSFFHVTVKSNK